MRKWRIYVITLCFLLCLSCANQFICKDLKTYSNKSLEELGKSVWKSLKCKKYKKYQQYFLTVKDIEKLMQQYPKRKKEWQAVYIVLEDYQKRSKRSFANLLKDLDWEEVKFKNVYFKKTKDDSPPSFDVYIVFSPSKNQEKIIMLKSCIQTNQGWMIGGNVELDPWRIDTFRYK